MGNSPVSTSKWHERDSSCDTSGNVTNTVPWFRFNPKFVGRIEKLDSPSGKPEAKSEQCVHTKQKRQCDHYPTCVKERHHQEHSVSDLLEGEQVVKDELSRKSRHKKCTHKNVLHTTISECELSTLRKGLTVQNVHPFEKSVFPVIYSEIQQRLDVLKDSMVDFCGKVKEDIEKTTNDYTSALLGLNFNPFQTAPLELERQIETSQWTPLTTATTALNYLGDFRNNRFKKPTKLIDLDRNRLISDMVSQGTAYQMLFDGEQKKRNDRRPESVNFSKTYGESIPTTDRMKQKQHKENGEDQYHRIKRNHSYFNIHKLDKEKTPMLLRTQQPKVIKMYAKNTDDTNPAWKNVESSKKDFGYHRHSVKKISKRTNQEVPHGNNGLKMCKTCSTTLKHNLKQADILLKAHDLCFNQVKDNELNKKWPNVGNFTVTERNSLHQNNDNVQPKSSRMRTHSMRKMMSILPPNQGYFSHSRARKHKRVIKKELIAGTEMMELENRNNLARQEIHNQNTDIPKRMESLCENHISDKYNCQHQNYVQSCDRSNFIEAKQLTINQSKKEKSECFINPVPAKNKFSMENHLIERWPEIQRSQRMQRQRENYKKKISKFHSPLPNGIRDHGNWHRGDELVDSGNFQKGDGIRNRNRESLKKPPEKFVKRFDNGKKQESRLTYF